MITPFLWFRKDAEKAAELYTSLFPNSKIVTITKYPPGGMMPEGMVMTVEMILNGQRVVALNGGPHYELSPAFSFVVDCESQAEIDRYWDALTKDGGKESLCGWCEDRYGLSWQIVPKQIAELMKNPRAVAAMMKMKKIDLAAMTNA